MIIFDLACTRGHRFEGWFASGEVFGRQQAAEQGRGPVCDEAEASRRPPAHVAVSKGARCRHRHPPPQHRRRPRPGRT
jgi:hypothetical protein